MCFSAPAAPVVQEQAPLPAANDDEGNKAAKDAAIAANQRRGFGNTQLANGKLGSDNKSTSQRPTLLGQAAAA